MAWCGVWCGVVWCGMVMLCIFVRCGVKWCDEVRCSVMW